MKPSKKFSLNSEDLKKQAESALVFLAPSLLALLTVLTPQVASMVPDSNQKAMLLAFLLWALNQATGLLKRYVSGK